MKYSALNIAPMSSFFLKVYCDSWIVNHSKLILIICDICWILSSICYGCYILCFNIYKYSIVYEKIHCE